MAAKKRTRLSPHDRLMHLLDCATVLILERGLSSFTIDALAEEAGVSSSLIYKYFDTRLILLQKLLHREFTRFFSEIMERIEGAEDFEEVVTIVVSVNFDEDAKGNILNILRKQADVREVLDGTSGEAAAQINKILIDGIADHFHLSPDRARQMLVFGSGVSQQAAEYFGRHGGNGGQMVKDAVRFIFAGVEAFRD